MRTQQNFLSAQGVSLKDFRLYLQAELARRCGQNPKYSLRAFARFLDVTPAFLSHLLRGRRAITVNSVNRFGIKLGLAPDRLEIFRSFHQKNKSAVQNSPAKESESEALKMRQLSTDQFLMISDWYHYAILELLEVRQFRPNHKWMARVLNISVPEVNVAIERLMRLGFIEVDKRGGWKNITGNNTTIGQDFTTAALKNLQAGILKGALDALETVGFEHREQSSITMAMDARLLPEIKKCIKNFRRDIFRFQRVSLAKDQVYQLSVSFYPVLKNLKEKGQS